MYITKKGQYALFFLVELAMKENEPVTVKNVSSKYELSEKYLEQIATQLGRMGIVNSVRGNKGGYYLVGDVNQYTVKEVIDLIEGKKCSVDIDYDRLTPDNKVLFTVVGNIGREMDDAVGNILEGITLKNLVEKCVSQMNYSYVI